MNVAVAGGRIVAGAGVGGGPVVAVHSLTGGVPRSPVVWISAPIRRSGLAMRSIGR